MEDFKITKQPLSKANSSQQFSTYYYGSVLKYIVSQLFKTKQEELFHKSSSVLTCFPVVVFFFFQKKLLLHLKLSYFSMYSLYFYQATPTKVTSENINITVCIIVGTVNRFLGWY